MDTGKLYYGFFTRSTNYSNVTKWMGASMLQRVCKDVGPGSKSC